MDNSEIKNIEELAKKADWNAVVDAALKVDIESAPAQLLAAAATNCINAMLKLMEAEQMDEPQMLKLMPNLSALLKKLKSDDATLYKSEAKRMHKLNPDLNFEDIIEMGEMAKGMFDEEESKMKIEDMPNYQILKILAENGSQKFKTKDFEQIYFDTSDSTHACFPAAGYYYDLGCFPLDEGGYAAILDIAKTEHKYCSYLFRDGVLTPDDSICPKPSLEDFFSNANDFPKPVFDALTKSIKSSKFWYVFSADEQNLTAKLSLMVNDKNKWLVWRLEPEMPEIPYVWNGSQFVIEEGYQPTEQDMSIFENA